MNIKLLIAQTMIDIVCVLIIMYSAKKLIEIRKEKRRLRNEKTRIYKRRIT